MVFAITTTDRGDVVGLVDMQGMSFAAYRYDAWGNPIGDGTGSKDGIWWQQTLDEQDNTVISAALAQKIAQRQVLRYAGYCYDSESGMYYLSARHYDPATRLFLSKDPSRDDGEESSYQYCRGNPVGSIDPTGYGGLSDAFHWFQRNINIFSEENRLYQALYQGAYTGEGFWGGFTKSAEWGNPFVYYLKGKDYIATEADEAVEWFAQKSVEADNGFTSFLYSCGGVVSAPLTHENIDYTELLVSGGVALGTAGAGAATSLGTRVGAAGAKQTGTVVGKLSSNAGKAGNAAKSTGLALEPLRPPNLGFMGKPELQILPKGTTIQRYGTNPDARYFTTPGTPPYKLSLPSAIEGLGKSTYVVDKPIKVLSGRVAPAYLQPGGGNTVHHAL